MNEHKCDMNPSPHVANVELDLCNYICGYITNSHMMPHLQIAKPSPMCDKL